MHGNHLGVYFYSRTASMQNTTIRRSIFNSIFDSILRFFVIHYPDDLIQTDGHSAIQFNLGSV